MLMRGAGEAEGEPPYIGSRYSRTSGITHACSVLFEIYNLPVRLEERVATINSLQEWELGCFESLREWPSWDLALSMLAPGPVLFPLYLVLESLSITIPLQAVQPHRCLNSTLALPFRRCGNLSTFYLSKPSFLHLLTGANWRNAPVSIPLGYCTSSMRWCRWSF